MYTVENINSKFIKETMYEKGYVASDIVRETGINRTTISLFLSKKRLPKPKNAKKIANFLGLDIKDLFIERRCENE